MPIFFLMNNQKAFYTVIDIVQSHGFEFLNQQLVSYWILSAKIVLSSVFSQARLIKQLIIVLAIAAMAPKLKNIHSS